MVLLTAPPLVLLSVAALLPLPPLGAADLAPADQDDARRMTPVALEESDAGPKLTPEELEAALEEGLRRFERSADDWTLRTTGEWQQHIEEVVDRFQRGLAGQDRERRRREFPDLPDELWHSYQYKTGVGNREELTLHNFVDGLQLNITGPPLDAPPQWQVVSHRGIFFLFGLYPFAGATKIHIVKTDFKGLLFQRTVDFHAADLRIKPFLHHMHPSQGAQLLAFVKRPAAVAGLYGGNTTRVTEQVFCLLVNQDSLTVREICSPLTLPSGASVSELVVDVLLDPFSGSETVVLFPVRLAQGLVAYKLSSVPFSDRYNLGIYSSIRETDSLVWKVRLFSVSGSTYVVVSYGNGPLERMVQVFRHDSGAFSLVQTLSVESIVINIEVFSIGFQHYLVLGQEERISLYIWHHAEFQLLQSEPSQLTYKWTVVPVKSCRHEVILVKVFNSAGYRVEFYHHNVQTQKFEAIPPVPCLNRRGYGEDLDCFRRPEDVLDLSGLVGVTTDGGTYIITPSKLDQLVLVTVNASVDFAPDPVRLQNEQLLRRKSELQTKYDSLLEKSERLSSLLDRVVVPGSDQILHGNFNFLSEVTATTLDGQDTAFNRVHLAGLHGDVRGLLEPLTELTNKVAILEKDIIKAADRIADAVHVDSDTITITGSKKVLGSVTIDSLKATGPVHINAVQHSDLNSTLSNMVRINSHRTISGTKTLTAGLSVATELTVALLNSRPVSDIVTADTIQEVPGQLVYGSGALHVDTLSVGGRVGGVDTTQLLLYDGSSRLPVPVNFDHLDATSLTVGKINGQSPEKVFSNVLLSSGGTFINSVTFEGDVSLGAITINGTLNGEDAAAYLSSVLFIDSAQKLDALWLSSAAVAGSLSPQTVNSRPFPGGRYVTRGGSYVISGKKTLNRAVAATVTASRVDGVPVTQLVTLDTDQTLTSLSVPAAVVLGALTVGGKIDGVTVAPGWLDNLLANGSETIEVDVAFSGGVTVLGDLHVSDVSGGFASPSLEQLFGGLIAPEPGESVTITGKKRFTAAVTADQVSVGGRVNGADPADWLTVAGKQLIVGPLTLAGRGFFANVVAAGSIDDVDITALMQDAIYTDSEQEQLVFGVKAFTDPVTMSTLSIDGPVNGVTSGQVLWTTGTQTITGTHTYLGPVRAGGLHAYLDLQVPDGARVGGLDFSELSAHAATAANDTHTEKLIFDRIVVRGDVLTDKLNGVDVKELADLILRHGGGRITGRWRFESLVVNGSITSAHGAGGYRLDQLKNRVVSLSGGGTLRAPVFFENLVVEEGGEVTARVVLGGVPWEQVLANLASQHRPIVINGSKTFSGGLRVVGQLRSPSLPLQNLLLVGADQTVTGTAFFHSDVTIHTDLTVRQPINGRYDVTDIERLFVTDSDEVTIDGDIEISADTAVISDLRVSGLLAGLPVTSILSDAVPLGSNAHLTGHLTFLSPVHATTLHLTDGWLNERDLSAFLSTVRLVTQDQVFSYPVQAGNVTLTEANVRNLKVEGLVNGVNLTEVFQRLIYLDGNYVFSGLWTVPGLSVAGDLSVLSINGQLPERLLRLDGTEVLDRLTVTGDVYTTTVRNATRATTLNGYVLWEEINNRLRLSETAPQTFLGTPTFTGRVIINGNILLGGRLNGLNTTQFVVLDADNSILANLQFAGRVTADRLIVRGLIDGVNVSQCAASAVYSDRNITLHGHYAVTTTLADGFDGERQVDVDKAHSEITSLLEQCEKQQRDFNNFFSSQCMAMRNLYSQMRSTYYAVRYFDELQELTWPDLDTILSTLVIEDGSGDIQVLVTYSRLSGGCPESRQLAWRADSGRLQLAGAPHDCGAVRQWRHLRLGGRHLLVSAAERPPPGCSGPLSTVWLWGHGRIQPSQRLEIAATQVFYTAPRPGVAAQLRFLDPARGELRQLSYNSADGSFIPHRPQYTQADLLAVRTLPDASLLVLAGEGSTVVARRLSPQQATLHEQRLGALTATTLLTFTRRGRTLFGVGDGGWSALVNSPQGVKIFEYFGNGTHRCVPAQHLAAVSPADLALVAAGSLPDLFLVVAERDCGLRIFIDKGEAGFIEFQRVTVPGAESVAVLYPSSESPPHLLVSAGRRLVLLSAQMMGAHVPPVNADCSARLPPVILKGGPGEGRRSRMTGADWSLVEEGGEVEEVSGELQSEGVTTVRPAAGTGAMVGGTGGDR